jgi:hypothetical protein
MLVPNFCQSEIGVLDVKSCVAFVISHPGPDKAFKMVVHKSRCYRNGSISQMIGRNVGYELYLRIYVLYLIGIDLEDQRHHVERVE